MRNYAYSELYLPLAQRVMGDMYDYAVNVLGMKLREFHELFMISGMSDQFEIGNSTYVAGKNGCEVAREVIETCTDRHIEEGDEMQVDKSPEYWTGWALAYYQWISDLRYEDIDRCVPIETIRGMYPALHESDVTVFVDMMDKSFMEQREESRLKRLRAYAGLSQRALADKSGVPLRQIQLFEQGQRDITKTQGQTLFQLSRTLGCSMEDLL